MTSSLHTSPLHAHVCGLTCPSPHTFVQVGLTTPGTVYHQLLLAYSLGPFLLVAFPDLPSYFPLCPKLSPAALFWFIPPKMVPKLFPFLLTLLPLLTLLLLLSAVLATIHGAYQAPGTRSVSPEVSWPPEGRHSLSSVTP